MSHQQGRAVSEILNRHFGDIVQKVGDDLFSFGSKPIGAICKSTGLPRIKVIESLRTLLKFDLALFEASSNDTIADYRLIPENVLLLIRYPRYLLQIKSKYGSEAELLVEELLQHGYCTATKLLVNIAKKYKDDKEKNITLMSLKDMFVSIVTAGYIQQAPVAEMKEGSEIPTLEPVATIVPELDIRKLMVIMTDSKAEDTDNIYWRVNYDRFHQDFRDDLMIQAMTIRIDENAGELMRHMLMQMYVRNPPWASASSPIPALDLKECCKRASADHPLLMQHVDHYFKVLEENGAGFVRRTGDASGGQYCVELAKAAAAAAAAVLEHTVTERLGSKAARIWRLIHAKKYIEEEDIQKHAMLPNKECKQLTYKLMEEHFISVQPMRKTGTGGGIVKAIYLYYINLYECALELSHRAVHNAVSRARHSRAAHARLLDKQRRVRTILHGMRCRGDAQENIDDVEETITPPERLLLQSVEKQLKQLSAAEIELDKTLFILHWFFMYK